MTTDWGAKRTNEARNYGTVAEQLVAVCAALNVAAIQETLQYSLPQPKDPKPATDVKQHDVFTPRYLTPADVVKAAQAMISHRHHHTPPPLYSSRDAVPYEHRYPTTDTVWKAAVALASHTPWECLPFHPSFVPFLGARGAEDTQQGQPEACGNLATLSPTGSQYFNELLDFLLHHALHGAEGDANMLVLPPEDFSSKNYHSTQHGCFSNTVE